MKKIFEYVLIAMCLCSTAFTQQNYNYEVLPAGYSTVSENVNTSTLKYKTVAVPEGVVFRAVFTSPVDSQSAYTGQQVFLVISSDFYYNGKIVASSGSAVTGTVIDVSRAKHGSLSGKLSMRFTKIITPEGDDIPISAIIKTDDNSGVLIGGNIMDDEVNSQAGRPKRGTVLTSVVGSGGGLVKSIWDKGQDVFIPVNASVELILIQPITLNPQNK